MGWAMCRATVWEPDWLATCPSARTSSSRNIAGSRCRGPFLNRSSIGVFAERLVQAFQIATPNVERPVRLLSGGNLQKVILAREITASSGLLVAVHPTRGLDVGATESVQHSLLEERSKGAGILLVSEDLDELMTICDRIAVMFEGRVMGILPAEDANRDELGLMMAGENVDK